MQVQTLKLDVVKSLTPASSRHLVETLCSMPNLNDLTLNGRFLNEKFYSSLKAMASSIQVCVYECKCHRGLLIDRKSGNLLYGALLLLFLFFFQTPFCKGSSLGILGQS